MVVRFGNKDLAKYPFLKEAFSYITKYDFKLEDLDSRDYLHLIDKANEKIEQYLFFGRYEYQINYSKTHETIVQEEVIIFLISLLLVKSISIEAVTKKFALLESMRFEKYLISDLNTANRDDKTIKLILYKIFEDLFSTKILLEENVYNFYKIRITDYLDHPIAFQEKEWNLVNRTLHNGFVYLDGNEIVRLFRNELYLLIIDRIKKMSIDRIPDTIMANFKIHQNSMGTNAPVIQYTCLQSSYSSMHSTHI